MPRHRWGQQITFALEKDDDQRFKDWIVVSVRINDTIAKIVARRGHPEDALMVARKNGVRSINYVLRKRVKGKTKRKQYKELRVPGEQKASNSFHVLAGNEPPTITDGYAKFDVVERPERSGILSFTGYDPITMEVPIRFESDDKSSGGEWKGTQIEEDIALLERMAGRGQFLGAAVGPPPIIRINTTGPAGEIVPLIPKAYQNSLQNSSGPLWRVTKIDWEPGALRNTSGNRIRQLATVTVRSHTDLTLAVRSVAKRSKAKKKTKKKK